MKQVLTFLFFVLPFITFSQNKVEYWPGGKLKYEKKCVSDSCKWWIYYENGHLEMYGIDSDQYGLTTYLEKYCENGQLIKAYNPNSSLPEQIKQYNCDGTILKEYWSCKFGYRGEYKYYHSNGQVSEHGQYEATNELYGEQRVGLLETFTPEGVKIYEAFYENGVKVWEKKYYKSN